MKSIKLKLSLIANVIAIICLIVLSIISFIFTKKALNHELISAETNYVKTAENAMKSFQDLNIRTLRKLAKDTLEFSYNELNTQDKLMSNVGPRLKSFRDAGNYLAVYIAQPNGELIISDPDSDSKGLDFGTYGRADGYDARTREFYIEAMKKNDLYITNSYIDTATGQPCFTYAIPLNKDGKFIGILAIDVLTEDLQNEFNHLPGRTFVFDKSNTVFVSTDKTLITKEKNPDIDIIASKFNQVGNYNVFEYTTKKGHENFGLCTKVNEYTVCAGESVEVTQAPALKIAYIQIAIVIFTSIFSILLLYFIV
ncbi:cache domain-containing protein, partial [Campylobacter volucris]|uniref:PDC sensor domain-containing protein n=1 Tax=Campylobacter volucris TaxID=1031542 RepID=UPI00189EBD57